MEPISAKGSRTAFNPYTTHSTEHSLFLETISLEEKMITSKTLKCFHACVSSCYGLVSHWMYYREINLLLWVTEVRIPKWKSPHHSWTPVRIERQKAVPIAPWIATQKVFCAMGPSAYQSEVCHWHGVDLADFFLIWAWFIFTKKVSLSIFRFPVAILVTMWFLIDCVKA